MLEIVIPSIDIFNEEKQEFITLKKHTLQLEHSLVSLSKWEAKWCKPFLGNNDKTIEETIDYIKCMTITQNVSSIVYNYIPDKVFKQIIEYIEAPMTATWFKEQPGTIKNREVITAELLYYWMIAQNIPMECQKWHLNRLMTLIKVCGIKNSPPKKMNRKQMLAQRKALNESRRNQINTKG